MFFLAKEHFNHLSIIRVNCCEALLRGQWGRLVGMPRMNILAFIATSMSLGVVGSVGPVGVCNKEG